MKVLGRHRTPRLALFLFAIIALFGSVIFRLHYYLSSSTPNINLDNNIPPKPQRGGNNNNPIIRTKNDEDKLCKQIISSLNPSSWSDIVYHKDRPGLTGDPNPNAYDEQKFLSVEEDNEQARSTIREFNKLRHAVLTPELLNLGVRISTRRGIRPARAFAKRLTTLLDEELRVGLLSSYSQQQQRQHQHQHPLIIAVFGNSFTIGSNCGESSVQSGEDCAWPRRLSRRFDELFPHRSSGGNNNNFSSLVEWRMYQENTQGSVNIAQKMPSIIEEYYNRNVTPDAILLDNTIIDKNYGIAKPWFEAIVRAFIESFPDTVIVSMVSAIPSFVNISENNEYDGIYPSWMQQVQSHYGLAVVDFGMMVRHMRLNLNNTIFKNVDSKAIDLLWPQADQMMSKNGSAVFDMEQETGEVYWLNYLPLTRKTKGAYYPQNHPPWSTHQYVADTVMHALLQIVNVGLSCTDSQEDNDTIANIRYDKIGWEYPFFMNETVSPSEKLNECFICRSPLARIDAKSSLYTNGQHTTNVLDDDSINDVTTADNVMVTCGDWQWVTDNRRRSGWQSDQKGSLILFRLKIDNDKKLPTMSLTYMKSHEMFGNLMVSFRPVTRKESNKTSTLLKCNDVDKFRDLGWQGDFDIGGQYANDTMIIPSLLFEGKIPEFSLWETIVFSPMIDYYDVNARQTFNLLKLTLNEFWQVFEEWSLVYKDNENQYNDDIVEYIDLYVMNPEDTRVKIQVVTSC